MYPAPATSSAGNAVGVEISGIEQTNGQFLGGGNVVAGNLIGTDPTGTQPVSNLDLGVFVNNSQANVIGPGNVVSANGIAGVEFVGTVRSRTSSPATSSGQAIGGQIFTSRGRAVLSSNGPESGIPVFADAQLNGVVILGASQNTIGADARVAGSAPNTISGNVQVGVYIISRDFKGNRYSVPTGNVVSGNTLRSNGIYDVLLYNAPNNLVRPFNTSSRFLITNRFGGTAFGFRNYQAAFDGGTSLLTSGKKPHLDARAGLVEHRPQARHGSVAHAKPHAGAAHALLRARPRVPALFERKPVAPHRGRKKA